MRCRAIPLYRVSVNMVIEVKLSQIEEYKITVKNLVATAWGLKRMHGDFKGIMSPPCGGVQRSRAPYHFLEVV